MKDKSSKNGQYESLLHVKSQTIIYSHGIAFFCVTGYVYA